MGKKTAKLQKLETGSQRFYSEDSRDAARDRSWRSSGRRGHRQLSSSSRVSQSRGKKKGEKPSSDLAEIRNLTMNTLHIQLARLCSHGDGYKSVSAAIRSPAPKI